MGCGTSHTKVCSVYLLHSHSTTTKPYTGAKYEYTFLSDVVPVKLSSRTEGHVRHLADIEQMKELRNKLASKYEDNQRLLILHHIPPPLFKSDIKRAKTEQFQAILYKKINSTEENEKCMLSVVHVEILGKIVGEAGFHDKAFEVKSNTDHILEILEDKAATGARFVTSALTGSSLYHGFNFSLDGAKPVLQMDMLFEVPSTPTSDLYSYHIEPVNVIQRLVVGSSRTTNSLECDWVSEFDQQLKKGWRLVDIFADGSSKCRPSIVGTEIMKTFLWVYEKPCMEDADITQRYEGAVIQQSISNSVENVMSIRGRKAYWEDKIRHMGEKGWELACIILNPSVKKSRCKLKFGNIMFFQRLLL